MLTFMQNKKPSTNTEELQIWVLNCISGTSIQGSSQMWISGPIFIIVFNGSIKLLAIYNSYLLYIRHQYEFKTAESVPSVGNEDLGNYMSKETQKGDIKNLESFSF